MDRYNKTIDHTSAHLVKDSAYGSQLTIPIVGSVLYRLEVIRMNYANDSVLTECYFSTKSSYSCTL
jgi:hypothetical protein